ncbi:MAG: hypothetical protein ACLGHY_06750, partial [Gammaproteobacteria bacterium]
RIMVHASRGPPRRKVRVAIDGEIIRLDAPLEFSVAPQPLSVLMPPREDEIPAQPEGDAAPGVKLPQAA